MAKKEVKSESTVEVKDELEHEAILGDIVHYYDGRKMEQPGMIVRVWPNSIKDNNHNVGIRIFEPRRNNDMPFMLRIPYSTDPEKINTWHHKGDVQTKPIPEEEEKVEVTA